MIIVRPETPIAFWSFSLVVLLLHHVSSWSQCGCFTYSLLCSKPSYWPFREESCWEGLEPILGAENFPRKYSACQSFISRLSQGYPTCKNVWGSKWFLNKHILTLKKIKIVLLWKRGMDDKQLVLSIKAVSMVAHCESFRSGSRSIIVNIVTVFIWVLLDC